MSEANEEITVEDIQEIEAELGIDLDEFDYCCNGVIHRW
jgi:hypothetical protein